MVGHQPGVHLAMHWPIAHLLAPGLACEPILALLSEVGELNSKSGTSVVQVDFQIKDMSAELECGSGGRGGASTYRGRGMTRCL